MFIVCLLYVHDMHTVCLCMIIVCLLYVYCMFVVCLLYVHGMLSVCLCMIIICLLYVLEKTQRATHCVLQLNKHTSQSRIG